MRVDLLTETIEGLDEALAAVDAFDQVLIDGLLRPHPASAAGLTRLASAVAGTPLASLVAEAAEKAAAGAAGEDHVVALAGARAALLGSVHDALMARITQATGRPSAEAGRAAAAGQTAAGGQHAAGQTVADETTAAAETAADGQHVVDGRHAAPGAEHAANLLAAARSWLSDLARAGWRGIDSDLVAGSAQVVAATLADPALRRLATLLDGFAAELAACCPGASLQVIPVRRWADLWSRATLASMPGAFGKTMTYPVTGRLLPLGLDLAEHPTAVQAQVHAVLEPADGGAARLVRASVSAPKPDTIIGAGVWQLLRPHMSLLAAVTDGRSMDIADMPVTADGDLIWSDSRARLGVPADPLVTARVVLSAAADPATAPLDRHPARIAVPVFLAGYTAGATGFAVAGHQLAVDTDRIPAAGPLTPEAVAASRACVGLLRWDAGSFSVQPLAVETTVRKKPVAMHAGEWAGGTTDKEGVKAEKAAADAMSVLRERAGRLLRK